MHTFSCALQSVDVDGASVRFESDPHNYTNCRLYIGDNVLTFHRNGLLISVGKVDPEPVPDQPEIADEAHDEAGAGEEAEL